MKVNKPDFYVKCTKIYCADKYINAGKDSDLELYQVARDTPLIFESLASRSFSTLIPLEMGFKDPKKIINYFFKI